MNKIIKEQLDKVTRADLSNFNEETNTYFIPKKNEIKVENNKAYLIHIKEDFFKNSVVKRDWNNNTQPTFRYATAEINNILSDRLNVMCIEMNMETNSPIYNFWGGWIPLKDVEILREVK